MSLEVSEAEVEAELEKLAGARHLGTGRRRGPVADGMLVEADLVAVTRGVGRGPFDEQDARFVLGDRDVCRRDQRGAAGRPSRRAADGRASGLLTTIPMRTSAREDRTVYQVEVKALKRKSLPEVDDDARPTIGLDSLEALRETADQGGARRAEKERAQRRETWRRALLDQLADGADAQRPAARRWSSRGRGEDINRSPTRWRCGAWLRTPSSVDWQELAAKLEPEARARVLDDLILEQLADDWQVAVPEERSRTYVAGRGAPLGLPPAEHKANLAKEEKLDAIRHSRRGSRLP